MRPVTVEVHCGLVVMLSPSESVPVPLIALVQLKSPSRPRTSQLNCVFTPIWAPPRKPLLLKVSLLPVNGSVHDEFSKPPPIWPPI